MSAYSQAKLATQVKAEQDWENLRIQSAYDALADDEDRAADWKLWGGVLGGLLGFVVSNFNLKGAQMGYNLGGGFGQILAPEDFEESMFDIDPGLYGTDDIKHLKAEALRDLEDFERAQQIGLATSIFSAGMTADEAGWELGEAWDNIFKGTDPGGITIDSTLPSYDPVPPIDLA